MDVIGSFNNSSLSSGVYFFYYGSPKNILQIKGF
jgi:hypothetical protein